MTITEHNTAIKPLIDAFVEQWLYPEEDRVDVVVAADQLLNAAHGLKSAEWGYLAAITGLDDGVEANTFTILYHFCADEVVLTFRVSVPREHPIIDSIVQHYPNAAPYEREAGEMFGITFVGTPDSSYLFLPDDWPKGCYPLRKDEVLHDQRE